MEWIEVIRNAMSEYGARSVENMNLCRKLGREIIAAFDKYLSSEGNVVIGVPPAGDWQPDKGDYRDATFSFYDGGTLRVDDTQLGLGVRIRHIKDDGSLWLRVVVNLRKQGDRIGVFPDDGAGIWIPVDYREDDLTAICARLYENVLGIFTGDVNIFVHGSEKLPTIGFNRPATP